MRKLRTAIVEHTPPEGPYTKYVEGGAGGFLWGS